MGIKLNIGAGDNPLAEHFTNIDIVEPGWAREKGNQYDFLRCDVTEGLPYDNGTVEYIVAHHFLEHLPYQLGAIFLCECHRVLAPGGTLTLVCPDFLYLVEAYTDDITRLRDLVALMLYPQEQYTQPWHIAAYDAWLLMRQAKAAGFDAAEANLSEIPHCKAEHEWQVGVVCRKP